MEVCAVVGNGAASKEQVQFMVTRLLGLSEAPAADAADALAVAVTHLAAPPPLPKTELDNPTSPHTKLVQALAAGKARGRGRAAP